MAVDAVREGEDLGLLWQVGDARREKAERESAHERERESKRESERERESALVYRFIHIIYIYVAFFFSRH